MDPLNIYVDLWGDEFIEDVNALEVPVVVRDPHPSLKRAVRFNYGESADDFNVSFFGATVGNTIAQAIEEGAAEVVLHKMYLKDKSESFRHHMAPVGFWVGKAITHGLTVTLDPDCFISPMTVDEIADQLSNILEHGFDRRFECDSEATGEGPVRISVDAATMGMTIRPVDD